MVRLLYENRYFTKINNNFCDSIPLLQLLHLLLRKSPTRLQLISHWIVVQPQSQYIYIYYFFGGGVIANYIIVLLQKNYYNYFQCWQPCLYRFITLNLCSPQTVDVVVQYRITLQVTGAWNRRILKTTYRKNSNKIIHHLNVKKIIYIYIYIP